MCFFVPYADRYSKPLIAPEQGIDCFKVVCQTNVPKVYSSLFRGFLYQELKQCSEIPLVIEERAVDIFVIESGYHSYRSAKTCLQLQEQAWYESSVIIRCIIPAGSQYYENLERDEYVSSSIIILGEE